MNSFGHITPALRARDREKTENEEFLIIPNLLLKKSNCETAYLIHLRKMKKETLQEQNYWNRFKRNGRRAEMEYWVTYI